MKILIIGTVGTGKTTLAKKIAKEYNINHYEIDSIVHDDKNNGSKRNFEEQDKIIKEINKEKDWIIEGTLRKNLEYLLDMADKIIYLDISQKERNKRIFIRYIKQKLRIEKSNYKPTIRMLKNMYKWSKLFESGKEIFEEKLHNYKNKLEVINSDK